MEGGTNVWNRRGDHQVVQCLLNGHNSEEVHNQTSILEPKELFLGVYMQHAKSSFEDGTHELKRRRGINHHLVQCLLNEHNAEEAHNQTFKGYTCNMQSLLLLCRLCTCFSLLSKVICYAMCGMKNFTFSEASR